MMALSDDNPQTLRSTVRLSVTGIFPRNPDPNHQVLVVMRLSAIYIRIPRVTSIQIIIEV